MPRLSKDEARAALRQAQGERVGGAGVASAKYQIGPLCSFVMPVSDVEAWARGAADGERLIYMRGLAPARNSATVLLIHDYAAGRMVEHLPQAVVIDPATGKRETLYSVRRTRGLSHSQANAAGATAGGGAGRGASAVGGGDGRGLAGCAVPDAEREERMDAILRAFRRAANMGMVAPTNGELAKSLGLKDGEAARYLVNLLVRAGAIKVSDQGPRARRIVTIVATGRETKPGRL